MKKTIIINISGIIFHIDEDAYDKLQVYLETLKRYFGNKPESGEIIEDIEGRIAELLQPRVSDIKQSVNIDDVTEIISILGTPEDIAGAAEEGSEQGSESKAEPRYESGSKRSRRLYRDEDNAYIGGVCSGLGAYFSIDPVFFRIVFIALIFAGGISLIIYPILWIAVPRARTAAQKLEMKGEDVTISNIERTVREEFQQVSKNLNRISGNSFGDRIRGFFSEIFRLLGNFFGLLWGVFRVLFGVFLILTSLAFIIGIISVSYFNSFMFEEWNYSAFTSVKDFLVHFTSSATADALLILAFVIVLLPLAMLIYGGLKLIIRFKAKDTWVLVSLTIFWFISVMACTMLVFEEVSNFKYENNTKEITALKSSPGNTLYLNATNPFENDNYRWERMRHSDMFGVLSSGKSSELYGVVRLKVEKSYTDKLELEIIKEARGVDRDAALSSIKTIKIKYTQQDSLLTLDPIFKIGDAQWKFQRVKYILRVPIGMKVYLNESTRFILDNIENVNEYWDENMVNKTWQMTNNGLELIGYNDSKSTNLTKTPQKRIIVQIREHLPISEDQIERYRDHNRFGKLVVDGKKFCYGTIDFDIKKSDDDNIKVEVSKNAAGKSNAEASAISKFIEYTYEQRDSVLWLDPVFRFPENTTWNGQNVKVTLRLPISMEVYVSKGVRPLIDRIEDHNSWDIVNNRWKMTIDGLSEIEE